MAAPTDTDLKYYGGTNTTPQNNTDPYGGAIDTGSELVQTDPNIIIYSLQSLEVDEEYYGIFYRKNEATGALNNARVYNRAGMQLNSSSGTIQIISSSSSDTDIKIQFTGYSSAAFNTDTITVNGTTPVSGVESFDVDGVLMAEVLTLAGSPTTPVGNITVSVNSEIIAIIYGTAADEDIACTMVTSLYEMAVASSLSSTISGTNRLTAPASGIGSFSQATNWAGSDQSINVPTGILPASGYIGVCIKLTIPASMPTPIIGYYQFLGVIMGNPVS